MARVSAQSGQMPAFKSAAEKRAWLLAQLADVEKEALLEDMAAGTNDRITVRAGETFRIDAGRNVLYDGPNAADFGAMLARVIEALPLGSTFVVEAGKGGKVLSGGTDEGPGQEQAEATPKRPARKPKSDGVG